MGVGCVGRELGKELSVAASQVEGLDLAQLVQADVLLQGLGNGF